MSSVHVSTHTFKTQVLQPNLIQVFTSHLSTFESETIIFYMASSAGPSSVTIKSTSGDRVWNICPSNNFHIRCSVATDDVTPTPVFTWLKDGKKIGQDAQGNGHNTI